MATTTLRNTCSHSRSLEFSVALAVAALTLCPASVRGGDVTSVSVDAASRVTKIYGAGGIRGLESYQTGILVSSSGHIITVLSTAIDSEAIDCVLDDGRRYMASLVGVDLRRELAVLKIDGDDLPHFKLSADSPRQVVGTRVLALSNLFGVAVGDERVSVQHGVIAAQIPLRARRGSHEAAYRGDVYILDCTTNNPGSPGGCLVTWQGLFIGMLGKELRSAQNGTWLSYAMPANELALGLEMILSGQTDQSLADQTQSLDFDLQSLGFILVPDLLDLTPPFVEAVTRDTFAAASGLQTDDLVVAVGNRTVTSQRGLRQELSRLIPGDPIQLSIIRDGSIVFVDLGVIPAIAEPTRKR
ncbi:S1C family serine protease [Pirellulales bacterium]|nr:S1C family serine protease [Pirellulales bacterium]